MQALAQEVSDFVSSVKVKMTEEGTMAALRTVMKLCTLSASPEAQVRLSLLLNSFFMRLQSTVYIL